MTRAVESGGELGIERSLELRSCDWWVARLVWPREVRDREGRTTEKDRSEEGRGLEGREVLTVPERERQRRGREPS